MWGWIKLKSFFTSDMCGWEHPRQMLILALIKIENNESLLSLADETYKH